MGAESVHNPRLVAAKLLTRIQKDDAYANLVLAGAELPAGQAQLITEIVYGVTRMRRALDYLLSSFVAKTPDPITHNLLRIGTYQLHMMHTPVYAAVDQTVAATSQHRRGFVNAVLRRVAAMTPVWPNEAVRLSYPEWIVDILAKDLGTANACSALEHMNRAPVVSLRSDGYVQDRASQWVAELVAARAGERILDLCAGPGGKATLLSRSEAQVVAADSRPHRAALVAKNAQRTVAPLVGVVIADGRQSPFRKASLDRVLVDAPCSGLGVLGRRADARWRMQAENVASLASLQAELMRVAFELVRPGGVVIYSVCTMTAVETEAIDNMVARLYPDAIPIQIADSRWRKRGRGAQILPQDHNTDAMFVIRYQTSNTLVGHNKSLDR